MPHSTVKYVSDRRSFFLTVSFITACCLLHHPSHPFPVRLPGGSAVCTHVMMDCMLCRHVVSVCLPCCVCVMYFRFLVLFLAFFVAV